MATIAEKLADETLSIINPSRYLLEMANAADCNALHSDVFTPKRVAVLARRCLFERNELIEALYDARVAVGREGGDTKGMPLRLAAWGKASAGDNKVLEAIEKAQAALELADSWRPGGYAIQLANAGKRCPIKEALAAIARVKGAA